VFTIRRNSRSQSTGTGVHDRPDSAFTIHRNTHLGGRLGSLELVWQLLGKRRRCA
jgi:hypothetical protein